MNHLGVGKGDGTDWMFEILQVNEKIFEYSFQNQDMQHVCSTFIIISLPRYLCKL